MRRSPRPIIISHRIARLTAWARLWLVWFAGVFAPLWAGGAQLRARDLDDVARGVANIVIANAWNRIPAKAFRRPAHRHGRLNPARRRAFVGSRLRRALNGKDWPSRLAAIVAVMRDLEAHVAALVRRLDHGLSRLRVIDPVPQFAPPIAPAPFSAIACDDSS